MSRAAYAPILATPGVRALFTAGTVARLPVGFETLGIVLVVRAASGSFAIAGAAAAAGFTVAALTAAPIGRLVDRFGQRPVLLPAALWNGAAACALATAGHVTAPDGALIAIAACTGIMPPISACQRTILANLFADRDQQAAFTLEAIIQEAVFTGGPLIATVAASLAEPPAALYTGAALTILGTFWFTETTLSRAWRPHPAGGRGIGAIRDPAVLLLVVFAVFAATSFGAFEVGATAFSREQGSPNLAGLLLAAWAIGSAVGGLVYGTRGADRPRNTQLIGLAAAGAVLFLPAAVAPNFWTLVPLMAVAGMAIAPVLSVMYALTGEMAPEGMVTEAFSWLNVAFPIGFGLGAALSGLVADGPGARVAIAIAGAGIGAGALVVLRWRGTLAPREWGRSVASTSGPTSDVR